MAEVNPAPPSPEDLQRELDGLRAAQPAPAAPATPAAPQPSVGQLLLKRALRMLLLWALLIVAFLAIWLFLAPNR